MDREDKLKAEKRAGSDRRQWSDRRVEKAEVNWSGPERRHAADRRAGDRRRAD